MSHGRRVLALAGALVVVGGLFLYLRVHPVPQPPPRSFTPDSGRTGVANRLHLPPPETFEPFTYTGEDTRVLEATCADTYSVVLIFAAGVDYRTHPWDARYNVAAPCGGGAHPWVVPLAEAGLAPGERYYVIRAHQGSAGEWYNPY